MSDTFYERTKQAAQNQPDGMIVLSEFTDDNYRISTFAATTSELRHRVADLTAHNEALRTAVKRGIDDLNSLSMELDDGHLENTVEMILDRLMMAYRAALTEGTPGGAP